MVPAGLTESSSHPAIGTALFMMSATMGISPGPPRWHEACSFIHAPMLVTMNISEPHRTYPDISTVPSELSFEGSWDGGAVSGLIRSKCDHGETPAFLFLGKKEAILLKEHLAEAFGEDAVVTLHGTYYMGLEVVPVDCQCYLSTGGRKAIRTLQDPMARRPAWRDRDTEALWQFRI